MKILVIGDFHGKIPNGLEKKIKKENIDLVVSLGDYPPFHYRKLWFKHCYKKDIRLWEVIGKKKYHKLIMEDMKRAEKVLKKLNKLPLPIYTVLGNIDYPMPDDVADFKEKKKKSMPNWDKKTILADRLKKYKNIKRFDYSYFKFKDYVFIGMRGHSSPGKVKSKAYRKHRKKLDNLFKKFKKEKIIFVSHNVPYNTKLDKVTSKEADKRIKGEHSGSKLARRIIQRYHPILVIGGHIHENPGKDKLGKTIVLNPGAAVDGRYAIVYIDEKKGKIKNINFLR